MPLLSRHRKTVILMIVVIATTVLMSANAGGKYDLLLSQEIVTTLLAPVEGVVSKVAYSIRELRVTVKKIVHLYKENEVLRRQVDELRQSINNYSEIAAENQRLRQMLNYKQQNPRYELVMAMVVARDPSSWFNVILINKGSADGITKDMPVITPQGLVGNVVAVYNYAAKVALILDPRTPVGALVQRPESRVTGIVVGQAHNPERPRMVNLARDADIIKGDIIVTSGLGGIFPKGLLIGEVVEVINEEGGLLKSAEIKPAVDFRRLEEVFVIKKARTDAVTLPPREASR